MCGWYRRTTSEEELARLCKIPIPPQLDLPIGYNIAPTWDVLVIRYNLEVKQRSLDALCWGLILAVQKIRRSLTRQSMPELKRSTRQAAARNAMMISLADSARS
jgi:putative SOS response-associated peptidase YedK